MTSRTETWNMCTTLFLQRLESPNTASICLNCIRAADYLSKPSLVTNLRTSEKSDAKNFDRIAPEEKHLLHHCNGSRRTAYIRVSYALLQLSIAQCIADSRWCLMSPTRDSVWPQLAQDTLGSSSNWRHMHLHYTSLVSPSIHYYSERASHVLL